MAYRYGNRYQLTMFPKSFDSCVDLNDPVRAYDAFINGLNLEQLGITLKEDKVGNSEYEPRTMLKLLVYGYSYGWRSSRKLERAVYHDISFIWLMGGLRPDYKTIARFRQKNKKALKKVLKHSVRLCLKLELIKGNTLFVDGTKIRANAAKGKNYTKAKFEQMQSALDKRINEIIKECEKVDEKESGQGSWVKMKEELANNEQLRSEIKNIIKEFEADGEMTKNGKARTRNLTDPDSRMMKGSQGKHASYNVQSVVDEKHGLIVNVDAVSDTSDVNQFAKQITQAEEVIEKQCQEACADAGYADTEELAKIDKRGTKVIVPSQKQALHDKEKEFSKSKFKYDKEKACYICPHGQLLIYQYSEEDGKKLVYQIPKANICQNCPHYGLCTKAQKGRKIIRLANEAAKEKFEQQYEQEESQVIYRRRKACVEHPFGHIKRNLGMTNFSLRGREGAQTEIGIAATCFNLRRMITLLGGVQNFIIAIQ
jgi:transposase